MVTMTQAGDGEDDAVSAHVPRINQLDAATLDTELMASINTKLADAFKYFIRWSNTNPDKSMSRLILNTRQRLNRNPLDTFGPELETLLRCIVWRYSGTVLLLPISSLLLTNTQIEIEQIEKTVCQLHLFVGIY